jgi:DNA processing protein
VASELLKYQIAIDMIPKIGSINAKKLIAYCGGVEAVFRQNRKTLTKIPGIGEILAHEIVNQKVLEKAERELEFITKHSITAHFYLDPSYPNRLRQCDDGPIVLFIKGSQNVNLNQTKIISIVGTRNITDYGKQVCESLINELASRNHKPIIVSGLAYGVDICAHKSALKYELQTFAVLGHGLNTIYPMVHKSVAREIASTGALVTDFPSQTTFDRTNFIKRNRIIAGLSDATIVIESAEKGGSLITADIANSYNREVLAVPGQVTQKYSRGCNMLIKQNKAALIESAKDIEFQLGWDTPQKPKNAQQTLLFPDLTDEEKIIMDVLHVNGSEVIDTICLKTKLPVSKVSSILLNLEFSGLVKCKPGKVFTIASGGN